MYYRWKDDRIVCKLAIWGAMEEDARDTLDRLAGRARRLDAERESAPSADPGAVGLQRNGDVTRVQESDRRMSLFVCHPPDAYNEFDGRPVDYKCLAPHAPVDGNRAFDSALRDADGVFFVVDAREPHLKFARAAVGQLVDRLAARPDTPDSPKGRDRSTRLDTLVGDDSPLSLVVYATNADADDAVSADALRDTLELPDAISLVSAAPRDPGQSAFEAFETLAESLRPALERAKQRNRIPERRE